MNQANKCPQCETFILGTYCYKCKKEISEMIDNSLYDMFGGIFKDIFKGDKDVK